MKTTDYPGSPGNIGAPVIGPFTGEYRLLSNFYPISGREHVTSEHWFQAAKATNEEDRMFVLGAKDAYEAKARGRSIALRPDWNDVAVKVMDDVIARKFVAWSPLAYQLLATWKFYLEERNTWGDFTWGTVRHSDGCWYGKNQLGVSLMKRRLMLKEIMGGY